MADIIPPRRDELLTLSGIGTTRLMEYLERVASSVNGNTEELELIQGLAAYASAIGDIQQQIDDLKAVPDLLSLLSGFTQQPRVIAITADYTTAGDEVVICNNTAAITVTLNPSPIDGEKVHIKRRDGQVTFVGPVDGAASKKIAQKYDAPTVIYSADAGEWVLTSFFGVADSFVEISRGNIPGRSAFAITCGSANVGNAGFTDIWDDATVQVLPTAAETLEIVSDNANDTAAGTGAREVTLFGGLDANYDPLPPEVVTLNGLTPVVLTGSYLRTRSMRITDSGASRTNEGTITLQVTGGGGAVRQKIRPDFGVSCSSHYTVPAGKTAQLRNFRRFFPKGEDVIVRSRVTFFGTNTDVSPGSEPGYQDSFGYDILAGVILPEKADFRLQAKSTNAAPISTDCIFEILEEDV